MRIAGHYTEHDWRTLARRLEANSRSPAWADAYAQYYRRRINTRYIHPMASIERQSTWRGEGFALITIFCTLIEFLESFERGDAFRLADQTGRTLAAHEYGEADSKEYFTAFLTTRKPFNSLMPEALVESFYRDVRCGVFHEGRIRGEWFQSSNRHRGNVLVREEGSRKTLFRARLLPALEEYFEDYRARLLTVPETQQAFIRKFNLLCIP